MTPDKKVKSQPGMALETPRIVKMAEEPPPSTNTNHLISGYLEMAAAAIAYIKVSAASFFTSGETKMADGECFLILPPPFFI
jgi:hypothetical protein